MERIVSSDFLHLRTTRLAVAFARTRPLIGYLKLDSGGRDRNMGDDNLLRPGIGGRLGSFRKTDDRRLVPAAELPVCPEPDLELEDGISYSGIPHAGRHVDLKMRLSKKDELRIVIRSSGGPVSGRLFSLAFAPDVAPVSVWGSPESWEPYREQWPTDPFAPRVLERRFCGAVRVTLPEFGSALLRAVDAPDLVIVQEYVPDLQDAGLNHSWSNTGNMIARKAYHLGYCLVTFETETPREEIELILSVNDEMVPSVSHDFAPPEWNGLRRSWANAFTLNPTSLSLGDNLQLVGHARIRPQGRLRASRLPSGVSPGASGLCASRRRGDV